MKRFFSLMLVALLLVSAIPFQALAADGDIVPSTGSHVCGGSANGHTWTLVSKTEPTCTTDGVANYKCTSDPSKCATTATQTLSKLGHSMPTDWTIIKQPTCTETGYKERQCTRCDHKEGANIDALGHDMQHYAAADEAADCLNPGSTALKCSRCTATGSNSTDALGHNWVKDTAATGHVAATCEATGIEVQKCSRCDVAPRNQEIPALGHNYVNGVCQRTGCGVVGQHIATVTFHYLNANGQATSEVRYVTANGQTITPPAVPTNNVAGFTRWASNANGTGHWIVKGGTLTYSDGVTPTVFHAIYESPREKSEMKIYAVRYVNGVRKEAHYLYSYWTDTNATTNNMYQYLTDHRNDIFTAAVNALGSGYKWNDVSFYNYFTNEQLTTSNMKDNGDKSVYIKMDSKSTNEALVYLYVHKNDTNKTLVEVLPMSGYNAGSKVYLNNDVKNLLKNKGYGWSAINMYSSSQWESLKNGNSPSGTNVVDIDSNGTYNIHVVLSTLRHNTKADPSNPKTGDYITIAVTTMVLAAAAVLTLAEMKKRKMI